ncbi:class B secretin G-protein coupled receptor GPRmth5, partial [Biomphalaria glabrata]
YQSDNNAIVTRTQTFSFKQCSIPVCGNFLCCSCDHLCWFYGDCCPDYYSQRLNNISTFSKVETIVTAIASKYETQFELLRMWQQINLVHLSRCVDTLYEPISIINTCHRKPEVVEQFKNVLNKIKNTEKKNTFENYLTSKSMEDILESCESKTLRNDSGTNTLKTILYFDRFMSIGFYNVFCAVCNGVWPNIERLSLECNDSSIQTFQTLADVVDVQEHGQCFPFIGENNVRQCSFKNFASMTHFSGSVDYGVNICLRSNFIYTGNEYAIMFKNPDCFKCLHPNDSKVYEYQFLYQECKNLTCNCSEIQKSMVFERNRFFELPLKPLLTFKASSCRIDQMFQPWTNQCESLDCSQNSKPFYGHCIKFYNCKNSVMLDKECFNFHAVGSVKKVPVTMVFEGPKMPMLHIQMSCKFKDPLRYFSATTYKNISTINTDKLNKFAYSTYEGWNVSLQDFLLLGQKERTLNDDVKYIEQAVYKASQIYGPDALDFKEHDLQEFIAKLLEAMYCFPSNRSCVRKRFVRGAKNISGRTDYEFFCDKLKAMPGNNLKEKQLSFVICYLYAIRARDVTFINPIINNFITKFQKLVTVGLSEFEHVLTCELRITNRMLFPNDHSQIRKHAGGENVHTPVKTEDFNISCPEGRVLTFNTVEVQKGSLTNDIHIFVDRDELPLQNAWIELSVTPAGYDGTVESASISLCTLTSLNVSPCAHLNYLLFPYSQVVLYKKLLFISENLTRISEFIHMSKVKGVFPIEMIEYLESYVDHLGVRVYYKTSYSLTNQGVLLCVDPENIYHDDRNMIAELYKSRYSSNVYCISTASSVVVVLYLTVLLVIG